MRTIQPATVPDDERVTRIIARFRAAIREVRCIGSERLVRQGISMTHLHIMSMLERHGSMAMNRIAETLDVSVSNATGLIDRMEERGLVERQRVADDRRVVLVHVTEHGRQVLGEVETLRDDLLQRVLGRLDAAQLARVDGAFEDLFIALSDVVREAPDAALHAHAHLHPDEPSGAAVPS
jgi:DNA-binding MarR family transcriptional regulator